MIGLASGISNVKYKAINHLLLVLDDLKHKYLNLPFRDHTALLVSYARSILLFLTSLSARVHRPRNHMGCVGYSIIIIGYFILKCSVGIVHLSKLPSRTLLAALFMANRTPDLHTFLSCGFNDNSFHCFRSHSVSSRQDIFGRPGPRLPSSDKSRVLHHFFAQIHLISVQV